MSKAHKDKKGPTTAGKFRSAAKSFSKMKLADRAQIMKEAGLVTQDKVDRIKSTECTFDKSP